MRKDHRRPVHLARRRRGGARSVALPVLQRGDGRRRERHTRRGRHDPVRSQDLRQLRPRLARARGGGRGGRAFRQGARRRAQNRRVQPEARVQLAQLRAAARRPRRGRDRPEERARRREHRHERLDLGRARCWPPGSWTSCTCSCIPSPSARARGCSARATPRSSSSCSSETFETGVLNLVYAPAESHGDAGFNEAEARLPQPES